MALTYDIVEVRISHANSDDNLELENASVYAAQKAACGRIIETWYDHESENAGTGGYPSNGVVIEAYNLYDEVTDYCYAEGNDFWPEPGIACSAEWKSEDGSPYPREFE